MDSTATRESNGVSFSEIFYKFQEHYGLTAIQVQYLLYIIVNEKKAILHDGLYYHNPETENYPINDDEIINENIQEIDIEIDEEELELEELDQPDIPAIILGDAISQIKIRRGQPKFRRKLLKLYRNTCMITGCDIPALLEAAHITPHSEGANYNLSNGLLLRADIHTLFDLGMLSIDPETMLLKLNDTLLSSSQYSQYEGIDIDAKLYNLHKDYKLTEIGLRRRWQNFLEFE